MQRYSFQLSIGGNHIMSGSPKTGKKADQKNVPNGDLNTDQQKVPKAETISDKKVEKQNLENKDKSDMEETSETKPKGITKEVEEQLMKGYKHVSEAYKKLLIKFFKAADVDNVGYLTIQRFAPAVRKLGFTGTDRSIAKMFIDINTNFDGEITVHEFMNEMTKIDPRKMSESDLIKQFKKFDTNKDGYITKDELEKLMDEYKIQRTDILVKDIIKRSDKDGDGKISLEEFRTSCQYKKGSLLV